jgi:hypothetical protein
MLTFFLSGIVGVVRVGAEPGTVVAIDPSLVEYDYYALGQIFTVAVRIEDVEELVGLDIQISWNTTWIEYVNHTVKIPVESYPDGVLYSPYFRLKEAVDEDDPIPGSCPGTMLWVAYSSMYPASTFNGSGTVFEVTFRIKDYPALPNPDIDFYICFLQTSLSNPYACVGIVHTTQDCHVMFHAAPPPYGPTAMFTAVPKTANIGETVAFDASTSLPGFNGAHEVPIVRYRWSFGDGNVATTYIPIVYHWFKRAKTFFVTLTVYAIGATPETDSTTHRVTVTSAPVGGYSFPIKGYTAENPITIYLALLTLAALAVSFTMIKRNTYRRKT